MITWNGKPINEDDESYLQEDGVVKEYYEDGTLMSEVPYINGQYHGVVKSYDEDGTLELEQVWVHGKRRRDLNNNKLARLVLFGETKC